MARHRRIVVTAISWNLFHGRDFPPERGGGYVQVNRPLRREFAAALRALAWDVALLQEAPPRWLRPLGAELGASGASALTARNSLAPLRALAAELSPDLIASNEGGSNQLLARAPWRIEHVRRVTLTRRPERRRMLLARLDGGGAALAVANLHASTGAAAAVDVAAAARGAVDFAGDLPLIFGGDLNVRPAERPRLFDWLARRHGLTRPTGPQAIDHLLCRGLDVREAPRELPAAARELRRADGRLLRLSDHPCVTAAWTLTELVTSS